MKKSIFPAIVVMVSYQASGQSVKAPATGDARKVVEQAAQVIKNAKGDAQSEASRIAREASTASPRAEQAAAEAVKSPRNPDENLKLLQQADEKLAPTLKAAAPEGQAIIEKGASAVATKSPVGNAKKTGAGGATEEGGTRMEITSQGALYFDPSQSIGVFTDDVVVNHPQFHLTCDELEVYLLKDGEKKKPEPAAGDKGVAAAVPEGSEPPPADKGDAQIKQAIAKGRKVVIQKLDENGEIQVGICRHATYIGESGDIIMRDMPQVQRGRNATIATDPSTYMIIKQNGQFKTFGPARTEIIQKDKAGVKPGAPGGAPLAPTTPKPAKP